jgi:outer membrane protein OmpA-like peptidoglycan-associated protein
MLSKSHFMSRGVVAAAGLLALTMAAPQAYADNEFEYGGFLGLHIFSKNNEIGVVDVDDAVSPSNSAAIGGRISYALTSMFSAEGELGFIPSKVRDSTAELLNVVYRLQLVVHLTGVDKKLRPFAVVGLGGMHATSSEPATVADDDDFVFHGGVGLKYRLGETWGLRLDARVLFPPSSASDSLTNDLEALVGLYKTFPHKKVPPPPQDQDEDGMTDDVDNCPTEAEDKDGFQDDDGCPDLDNDSDGVADADDKCAIDPEDKDGFQDDDGCPDADNDADGILDTDDKCAMDPEDKDGFQDEDGCPELDNDADGLADTSDQCPMEAEDADGFQDEDGCPDPDNDGDGVLDAADKCPTEMETKNGFQDTDGCADEIPKQVQRFTGTIKGITFETGKDVIRKSSNNTLNQAVKLLSDYPELRIEISGHTDNVGSDDDNRALSQSRAEAVRQYMIAKGVDASRLEAKGYGPDRPIADNAKKAGRAQNRRVEFKLLSALTMEEAAPAPEGDGN